MKLLRACSVVAWFVILYTSCYFRGGKGCLDDERKALQDIMPLNSFDYGYSISGTFDNDCCEWEWVDCNVTSSHVIRITLHNSEHYSSKDQDFWNLDMSVFSQLKELQELSLVGYGIELNNQKELCNLTNLQILDLSDNSIYGELPSCLAYMSSLNMLKLSNNQFSGILPDFSNLSSIEFIDVSYNLFHGLIPLSTFANLSKLTYLDLSYNPQLAVESESPAWHPSFQLQYLLLAGCNLNHRSNHVVPLFLSTQYNLQTLDLSDNFLKGPFPAWMFHKVSYVLRLGGNSFVGRFPYSEQKMQSKLLELDISSNLFRGPLPLNISKFLPNLTHFSASSSGFTGILPPSLGELENLQLLDLSSNYFSGIVPTTLSKDSPLWYLNLSNNSLGGELFPEDCNMPQLEWLLLHDNSFTGNIPACLSKSPSLQVLDVRRNTLSGIVSSQMTNLFELDALLMGANHFTGIIPRQLCQMQKLRMLDLSNNGFSGSIPSCFNNILFWRKKFQADSWVPVDFTTKGNSYSYKGIPLTLMTGIDLSVNQLTDDIPEQLGELQALHSLNLSHNLLTGHFPLSFRNLTNLENLDLSHNRLTGKIPSEISKLSNLETFSVAFNDLSGRIPFDQQSSTFSVSSYIGNPKLCGEPVSRKCSPGESDDDQDDRQVAKKLEGNQVIDKPLFFYSFVFMSYSLGFWSFIAPLCFSKRWRRKYFTTLDRWMDILF